MIDLSPIQNFDSTKHFIAIEKKNGTKQLKLVEKNWRTRLCKCFTFKNTYDTEAIADLILKSTTTCQTNMGITNFFNKMGLHKFSSRQCFITYAKLQYLFDEKVKKLDFNLIDTYSTLLSDYEFNPHGAVSIELHPVYTNLKNPECKKQIKELVNKALTEIKTEKKEMASKAKHKSDQAYRTSYLNQRFELPRVGTI